MITLPSRPVRLVLPSSYNKATGQWLTTRLASLCQALFGRFDGLLLPDDVAREDYSSTILLTASFLMRHPTLQFASDSLRRSEAPLAFQERDSQAVLALCFPSEIPIRLQQAWLQYLAQSSGTPALNRPDLPSGCGVLVDSGIQRNHLIEDGGPLDDRHKSRSFPVLNQFLAEASQQTAMPGLDSFPGILSRSRVPWLWNTFANELEYRECRTHLQSLPPEIHIATTGACNIECVFCSYRHTDAVFRYLSLEDFRKLKVFHAIENLRLSSGLGEPSLNPHLGRIIEYLGTHFPHLQLNFFTNGLMWSKAGFLESLRHVSWLNVSLNAATPHTWERLCLRDAFQRVRTNLQKLREMKRGLGRKLPLVHGSAVVNVHNVDELPLMPRLCADLDISRLTLIPFFALGYTNQTKLGAQDTLEACRARYEAVYEDTVLGAQRYGISIELPKPRKTTVGFGLEVRNYFDFARLENPRITLDCLQPGAAYNDRAPCPSLWKLAAIASSSRVNQNHKDHNFLYPCLGPLASYDSSVEMALPSLGDFHNTWNSNRYQLLRRAQTLSGLSPICDECREQDSRDPSNFPALMAKLPGREQIVQITAAAAVPGD